jgi:SAM-dependent methyltransferase
LPKLSIDANASTEQLAHCFAKVKAAWEHLGQTRAHHSVLTDEDFLPENFAGSADRFWASGDEEVSVAESMLARHGRGDVSGMSVIEYGCGVGRLSTAFGKRFKHADCFDISEPHLEYARKRAIEVNAKRVSFHRAVMEAGFGLQSCDFFYSSIVFQHNPPPLIVELIRSALRSLRSNGIAMFQVPTYIAGYHFDLRKWLKTDHDLDMQMHCIPQAIVYSLVRQEGCTLLEVRENGAAGRPDLILSNVFVVEKAR